MADAEGFYATIGVGTAKASDWCELIGKNFKSCDDSSDMDYISAGYYFNKNFGVAVEKTSVDGFSASNGFLNVAQVNDRDATSTLNYTSVALFGLIRVPASDRFSVYGKVGIHAWEQENRLRFPEIEDHDSSSGLFDKTRETDGMNVVLGIGAEFSFNDYVAVRLDAIRYFLPSPRAVSLFNDDIAVGGDDIDAYSASLVVRF